MKYVLALIIVVATLLALTGCGDAEPQAHPIRVAGAIDVGDGIELRLLGATRARDCTPKVVESPNEVRVSVRCTTKGKRAGGCLPSGRCAGAQIAVLRLDEPVGNRKVVDDPTGATVLFCKSPQMPTTGVTECVGAAAGDPMPASSVR